MSSVCIKECTRDIYYLFASPLKHKSWILCNYRNLCCLEIFLLCVCKELLNIRRRNYNCHTLLRLWDSNLCSVKTCVFLWYLVKLYAKSVSKLSDSNRNSAGTEIVTFLDDMADLFSSEKSLKLSLCRCITLLYLSSAYWCRLCIVCLWWTCSTTDSVTSCASSEENDFISRIWVKSLDSTSWSRTHNCTDLHTLCNIIWMVNLLDIACCKSDLVSIWAVSVSCLPDKLLLWKFSFNCLWNRYCRICCTCYTHCLIYICTSWERISDCSAKTCSSATKRLNLCRMVVCLVLEVYKPLLCLSVHLNRYHDRACVDLIRLFLIIKLALCL